MCGIVGMAGHEPLLVARMADAIAHRGPDASGVYADPGGAVTLGHRRLSILDLHERGRQPMVYRHDGRELVLTFNGEIYNFRALRDELGELGYAFHTGTDSEVILAAYAAWGPAAVSRFNGMWAFAIWDAARGELFLSRDRFGKKPLYYVAGGGRFAFASEIKALLALPGFARRLEPAVATDYLLRGLVGHTERTFFAGVRALSAGHHALYHAATAQLTLQRYYAPGEAPSSEDLRSALKTAVLRRTVADVPIAISLSGGVDSAAIAALLADAPGDAIAAFTTLPAEGRREGDESARVRTLLARYGRYTLHTSTLSEPGFLRDYDKLLYHAEEPLWGDAQYVRWVIAESVHARGLKVLLTGEGADELLAGYWPAAAFQLRGLLRAGKHARLAEELLGALLLSPDRASILGALILLWTRWEGAAHRSIDSLAKRLGLRVAEAPTSVLAPIADGSVRDCLLHMLTVYPMPQLLMCNDKMSMAHGVESRAPFLDVDFAEAALALPAEALCQRGLRKAPLRQALRHDVPAAILARRKKDSFASPIHAFLGSPAMGRAFAEAFRAPRIAPLVDVAAFRAHQRRHGFDTLSTRLFWLERWARVFDVDVA